MNQNNKKIRREEKRREEKTREEKREIYITCFSHSLSRLLESLDALAELSSPFFFKKKGEQKMYK